MNDDTTSTILRTDSQPDTDQIVLPAAYIEPGQLTMESAMRGDELLS